MSLYVVTVITAIATAAVAIPDFIPAGFVLATQPRCTCRVPGSRCWAP
jgi:hypothetical protein